MDGLLATAAAPPAELEPLDFPTLFAEVQDNMSRSQYVTLSPLLPMYFNLKGSPFTLQDHFLFAPLFRTAIPNELTLMVARQMGKSTVLSTRGVLRCASIPNYTLMFVTPMFEMVRRFSNNYVREFIDQSPVRHLLVDKKSSTNVLQRGFRNSSKMIFSFAGLDANRTRGVSADELDFDEFQGMSRKNVGIISEVITASKLRSLTGAGTPLGLDNILAVEFSKSSQAEWIIRCPACTYFNIPSLEHDLLKMLGPYRQDITNEQPGLICAKCQRPLNPRPPHGRWEHRYPDRRWTHAGYHAGQMLLPMHYASPYDWANVLRKQRSLPAYAFANEVCGEPSSTGARLVTEIDIRRAATLGHPNRESEAVARLDKYTHRILAVDWGGGGESWLSFTVLALIGMLPDGSIEVPWAYRSLIPSEHLEEARLVLTALARFRCSHLIHDYNGSGAVRETLIIQSGFPIDRCKPIAYTGQLGGDIVSRKPVSETNPREYLQIHKSRAIQLTCAQIKLKRLRFFEFDKLDETNPGLLCDFLTLMEEEHRSKSGRNTYVIASDANFSDDFAQTVTFGSTWLWYHTKNWPQLAASTGDQLPREMVYELSRYQDWPDSYVPWD
jgi:hypothetical protein